MRRVHHKGEARCLVVGRSLQTVRMTVQPTFWRRTVTERAVRMMCLLGILAWLLVFNSTAVSAGRWDRDEGTIESMSDGMVEIKGVRGVHILEP